MASGFKKAKQTKRQLDKVFLGKVQELGKKHDGQNFSCLAVSIDNGLTKENFISYIQRYVAENVTTELGWVKMNYKDHIILSNEKLERTYYYRPVGVADNTIDGGMRMFDVHINLHFKEDFELWLQKVKQ